jgi:predicted enzyme related to lactoylglutathione lyase
MHVRGIDATYYTVENIDAVTAFYTKILGNPTITVPGAVSEWTFADESSFGLYHLGGKPPHPFGSVMFAVDDLAATIKDLEAAGITLPNGGSLTETAVCHMAFGFDPEGNQFILHHRKPAA